MTARGPASEHQWEFRKRFRRHAFGWRSQPAIQRVKEAVSEIKTVARRDAVLAAEGAVVLIVRISPALEQVDSSSGAIGTAVNNALRELVTIIANAPVDAKTRDRWLERLWEAHAADQIPYIERLGDDWGELCGSKEVASAWAERLFGVTRMALSPDKNLRGYFHGTTACLSALFRAERYKEIIDILTAETFWPHQRWAVKALAAMGERAQAIRLAESSRGAWTSDREVDRICEDILLSSGLVDEAYERYGLTAHRSGTYLATFHAVAKKYPHKTAAQILEDLVRTTPGEEGKWFAAAKDAGLHAEALALARQTPCDPRTLARAARDLAATAPAFAVEAGLLALHWLRQGYGYEMTSADVWDAYSNTINAAARANAVSQTKERIRKLITAEGTNGVVAETLSRELGRGMLE